MNVHVFSEICDVQVESSTSRQGLPGDVPKEKKEVIALAEADAAAAATALNRAEAAERVDYADEEAGGNGMPKDRSKARERRAILQKAVLDLGVGGWEAKVI